MDWTTHDRRGNIVTCVQGHIFLKLAGKKENAIRKLGIIDEKGDYHKGVPVELKRELHYLREYKGWGINYEVVKRMEPETRIYLHADCGVFEISASVVKETGEVKEMLSQGYEVQWWVKDGFFTRIEK